MPFGVPAKGILDCNPYRPTKDWDRSGKATKGMAASFFVVAEIVIGGLADPCERRRIGPAWLIPGRPGRPGRLPRLLAFYHSQTTFKRNNPALKDGNPVSEVSDESLIGARTRSKRSKRLGRRDIHRRFCSTFCWHWRCDY